MEFNYTKWLEGAMKDPEQRAELARNRAEAVRLSMRCGSVSAPDMFRNMEQGDRIGVNNHFLTIVTSLVIKMSEWVKK